MLIRIRRKDGVIQRYNVRAKRLILRKRRRYEVIEADDPFIQKESIRGQLEIFNRMDFMDPVIPQLERFSEGRGPPPEDIKVIMEGDELKGYASYEEDPINHEIKLNIIRPRRDIDPLKIQRETLKTLFENNLLMKRIVGTAQTKPEKDYWSSLGAIIQGDRFILPREKITSL